MGVGKQKIGNDKKLSDTRWKWSKNTKNDIIILKCYNIRLSLVILKCIAEILKIQNEHPRIPRGRFQKYLKVISYNNQTPEI